MLLNWIGIMKGISVYLDSEELDFLNEKVSNGYKISSLVRHILLEWIKKEIEKKQRDGKDGSK